MSTKAVLDEMTKLNARLDDLSKPAPKTKPSDLLGGGAPHARKGENPLTSRGYSFLKLFGALGKVLDPSETKIEIDIHNRLQKAYMDMGYVKAESNSILAPFGSDLIATVNPQQAAFAGEIKELVKAGAGYIDLDNIAAARTDMARGGYQKALSWVDAVTGGTLVGPPLMGELIEVLRNNEALMNAGCRVIAMPPSGRIVYPRQTGAGTAYHVGESTTITDSTQATGDLILQAKKITALTKIPNELFRFAAVSVEMFVREDLSRVLALKMDKTLLEDAGSGTTPKGLINYASITSYTSVDAGTTTDGYTFQPEDIANMVGNVEEKNAIFRSFIMRPLMWGALVNRRADAVTAGDKKGPFVFNILRGLSDQMGLERLGQANLYGYPVIKSTQVSNTRTKGSGTTLSYILGGDFTDYILALGGVIEFQISTQGDTPFTTDQTWVRSINYYDGGPRHEASFVLCDQLKVS